MANLSSPSIKQLASLRLGVKVHFFIDVHIFKPLKTQLPGSVTFQKESLAPVVPEFLEEQPHHGAPQPGILSLRRRLVVQQNHVRLAPLDEFLLVLVVGDDGPNREVALLQSPQHEARDGQVDSRLDVRGLEQLVGSAVQQQQRAGPGLQLVLQPLHALTRHHRRHSHDHGASARVINSHRGTVNPPVPRCDMTKT